MKLYHYDSSGKLFEGKKIELQQCPDEYNQLCNLFPNGMSEFGLRVLKPFTHPVFGNRHIFSFLGIPTPINMIEFEYLSIPLDGTAMGLQEYNLELVRRAFSLSKPSRLDSLFALSSPDDLINWRHTGLLKAEGRLFEINTTKSVKLDARHIGKVIRFDWTEAVTMSRDGENEKFCDVGFSANELLDNTLNYWNGIPTDNPMWEHLVKLPVEIGCEVSIPHNTQRILD